MSTKQSSGLLLLVSLIHVCLFCGRSYGQLPRHPEELNNVEEAQEIRRKWGIAAENIVHNLEHIKADVDKIMHLQEIGELDDHEALFYFFRMHDFDENGKLDGHELMAALRHSMTDATQNENLDLIPMVDGFMELDDDKDGFLTYSELRKNLGNAVIPQAQL